MSYRIEGSSEAQNYGSVEQKGAAVAQKSLLQTTNTIGLERLGIPQSVTSQLAKWSATFTRFVVGNQSFEATAATTKQLFKAIPSREQLKQKVLEELSKMEIANPAEPVVNYMIDLKQLKHRVEKGGDISRNPLKALQELKLLQSRKPECETRALIAISSAETGLALSIQDRLIKVLEYYCRGVDQDGNKQGLRLGQFVTKLLTSKYFPKPLADFLKGKPIAQVVNRLYEGFQAQGAAKMGDEGAKKGADVCLKHLASVFIYIAHQFSEVQVDALKESLFDGLENHVVPGIRERGFAALAEDRAEKRDQVLSYTGISGDQFDAFFRLIMGLNHGNVPL